MFCYISKGLEGVEGVAAAKGGPCEPRRGRSRRPRAGRGGLPGRSRPDPWLLVGEALAEALEPRTVYARREVPLGAFRT